MHLIGKDILKFHAVIWPAMLMAADIEVPRRVGIHGFLLIGEHKMSKSLGNVIDPFQVVDLYGADALRYYAMREVRFGQDGEVSPEGFESRYTSDLANEYGNLASRTLAMIGRYRDGVVPRGRAAGRAGRAVRRPGRRACARAWTPPSPPAPSRRSGSECAPSTASSRSSSRGSWPRTRPRRSAWTRCCFGLAEGLRVVSLLLWPFVPTAAERLLDALGADDRSVDAAEFGSGAGGATLGELGQLFPQRRARRRGVVVDTHCHLDSCRAEPAEVVERARAAGVTKLATVGTDRESVEAVGRLAAEHDEVFKIVGLHPNSTAGYDGWRARRRRRASRRWWPSARPASTTTATTRRARTRSAPSRRTPTWRASSTCRW